MFREATPGDALALRAIYAPYVSDTAVTYEYEVPSIAEFGARIRHTLERFPYIVAAETSADGTERITGFAYAGPFHEREAYRRSAEISIYLAQSERGHGLGTLLYAELERRLSERGFTTLYACIAATHRNPDAHLTDASIRFHKKMGFTATGRFSRCAHKFGVWYDMVYMEKHIARFDESTPAEEVFDVYDENRIPTGITVVRGKNVRGDLHLVVHVCVFNAKGEMLIQKRTATKATWAGLWDFTIGGHVDAGETSREGAARELSEELGLTLALPERPALTVNFARGFDDYFVYAATPDEAIDPAALRLQESEVAAVRWTNREEIHHMTAEGTFIPYKAALVDMLFALRTSFGAHAE